MSVRLLIDAEAKFRACGRVCFDERVDNLELLKKIVKDQSEVCPQGRSQLGMNNCITKEAYTQWVNDKVEEVLLPFLLEPYMNILQPVLTIVPTFEVGKLKETIKILEKENDDLRSNFGRLTREMEDFELNLNYKRIMTSQAIGEA